MRHHAPQYPRYTTPAPERVLAYWTPREGIITEHNKRLAMPSDLSTLRDILWTENLLLYVDSIASFPLLPEIIYNEHCEVSCTSKGEAIGIRLKGEKNTTRWIVSAQRWGLGSDRAMLILLRQTFSHCKVGCASTPGSLGQALMRTTYGEHHLKRHTRPHGATLDSLRQHAAGGRVDTPGLGKKYDRLLELDMKGAYNAHYGKHPTGTCIGISANFNAISEHNFGLDSSYVTWWGECEIHLGHALRLGPFPVRGDDSTLTYPQQPGTYRTWLWREQAEDIRLLGGTVKFLRGSGWKEWTEDNQHYAAVMECLRREAPTKAIADLIKKATVAGIGRHAMSNKMYCLVPPERKSKGDIAVGGSENGQARAYNWYVHEFMDPHNTNMLHWNAYTVMQCSRSLFWKALPYAEMGALVATNYDAIYLSLWRYEELALPEKGSQEDNDSPSGTWRYRILYDAEIPAPRHLIATDADGKPVRKQPGVQRDE